ncbi:microfibrillar associated protein 1 [Echinococcus multilocularis]|uniref:Microfibrillar associated protein 1 n=1 Tax=Echinococcus multilocularis TaxID=6211 RepID=A0A087VZE9_ECHMU|nr:microfibrillar associated protein 1 [Echinococcus multilocularis]
MTDIALKNETIQCTAGAIPVKNEKGQTYMQKVKVHRYIAGKRPDFASDSEGSDISDFEVEAGDDAHQQKHHRRVGASEEVGKRESISVIEQEPTAEELSDPRFRRLMLLKHTRETVAAGDEDAEDRVIRHKRFRGSGDGASSSEDEMKDGINEEEEEEEVDEEELARRRELIRQRARKRRAAEEADLERASAADGRRTAEVEEAEKEEEYEEEEEEEEEYTSSGSEDEMGASKLKPVFVRRQERITLQAKQRADQIAAEAAAEAKRLADERRRDTLKLLEAEIRREAEEARLMQDELEALDSDDAAGDPQEQEEYELWKVRELKRIRRDREAREAIEREKAEVERVRAMTEAERQAEFRKNPKEVTNKAVKGKYKFLQKYYHRGAFFVQTEEEKLYQRDFSKPTLEDHFDKTKLPPVLRVKNFGRAGRTKYTHLVDQDTTAFDAAWTSNDPLATKFQMSHGGGFKEVFEKPTSRKNTK